jgi:hypothetical protein
MGRQGFDRPVDWAEHATVAAPFLEAGVSRIFLSNSKSQTRDYTRNQAQGEQGKGGGANRRLKPGVDFTWPHGVDGGTLDLSTVPADPRFTDHSATVFDASKPTA